MILLSSIKNLYNSMFCKHVFKTTSTPREDIMLWKCERCNKEIVSYLPLDYNGYLVYMGKNEKTFESPMLSIIDSELEYAIKSDKDIEVLRHYVKNARNHLKNLNK